MNHFFDEVRARMGAGDTRFIETDGGDLISYGDILARSARIANLLVALGVEPGDRVAAQVEKSPDVVALYLACIRAGAVFLPLNPAYTSHELEYYFGDAEPRLIICAPSKRAEIAAIAGTAHVETLGTHGDGSFLARAAASPSDFIAVDRGANDLAAILYTSGTTGRSKGAMLTHENLASNARTLVEQWRFTRSDVLIHALPVFHTHGLFVATNVVLFSGASILWLPRFDTTQVIARFRRASVLMGVPTFYVRLLEDPALTREATQPMRLFISGSAPLLAETFTLWRERTGHAIIERYGMTETNMNTSNPYDGDRVAGTVGKPLAGVDLRITDPSSGTPLADGEIGLIEVRGPNIFKGYWRMPEKTAEDFRRDGFFMTGDLGKIDERGYLHIVGRSKDIIISGGLNVYPKEVESEIDQVPGVAESAVIGLPHSDFGEGVTAVVVRSRGSRIEEGDLVSALEGRLARYKQPKRVVFVDQLPRNAMGKVQKNVLRERFGGLYSG